jgi:signal transduction histidine kinase
MWTDVPLRRQGIVLISVPVLCLFLFLCVSIYLRYYTVAATRYITHTQQVLIEGDALLIALLSAETSVRGYESTHDVTLLMPYNSALQALPRSIRRLKSLVQDSPKQLQRVQAIEQGVGQELKFLGEDVRQAEALGSSFSQRNNFLVRRKATLDKVRSQISQFQAQERQLLILRERTLENQEQVRGWVQLCMSIISVLASLSAIYLFDRIEHQRQEGEKQLETQAENVVQLNKILAQTNITLADRNQELDQFAYVASHDLKAPLRAIANLSEWIEEDLGGQVSPEVQHHMHLMRKRVERMDALINGLLDYSRVGRVQVPIETVKVADILAEVIDLLAPPATFLIEVAPMPIIETRRLSLSQVFANLISNAIKHCNRADGHIQISFTEQGNFYRFSVSDNGPGIAPEYQSRIFTIFQTLEARDKTENTGIGLSIVKKIVESEGGSVWVESQLGLGSTFLFTWCKRSNRRLVPDLPES